MNGEQRMDRFAWSPNEISRAGQEHLDPAHVDIYDRKSATDPGPDVELLRQLGLDDSSVLVDLGAGTGTFAIAAAPWCARVVAVDVSEPMLARLREKAAETGIDNLQTVNAGFLGYQHGGEPPDVVYTRNALHHLPDFWKAIALRRIHEMLVPDGVLRLHDLVYSFEPDETEAFVEQWLTGKPARPEDGYTREDLETHIREEFSTFSWLLEPMLERVGFEIRDAEYRGGTYAAYTCLKR